MKSAKKIIDSYNELIINYQNQIRAYDEEMDAMFDEIGNVTNYYDGLIEQIAMVRDAYVRDKRGELGEIKRNHMDLMDESLDEMGEIESIVNVLNGRAYRPVYRIAKENVVTRGVNRALDVYYFDELYDSDFLSLRAVIFSDKRKQTKRFAATNDPAPMPYTLVIIGFAEHCGHGKFTVSELGLTGMGNEFFNVKYRLKNGHDLQKLIDYYESNVKGFEEKNVLKLKENMFAKDRKILSSTYEFLMGMLDYERKFHEFKENVLNEYSKNDFEDIIYAECSRCGKDFLTERQVENAPEHQLFCWHCGNKMVE